MLQRISTRISAITLLMALVVMARAGVASANGGPPRTNGSKGGAVLPGTTSQMHVKREVLRFDLSEDLDSAMVSARYELESRGEALDDFAVIFVWQASTGHIPSPTVTWNGQTVKSQILDFSSLSGFEKQEMERAWSAEDEAIDPVSGEMVELKPDGSTVDVTFLSFALDVPANSTGLLEVSYKHRSAMDRTGYIHPRFAYQYLLLPARSWAAFGPLEIDVKGPGPEEVFFKSNLPIKWEGESYRASLPGLPDQNLTFSVMSSEGLIGNWVTPTPYYYLAFAMVLVGATLLGLGLGWLAGWIRPQAWAAAAAVGVGFFVGGMLNLAMAAGSIALFSALRDQSYVAPLAGLLYTLIATVLTVPLAGISAWRRSKRRFGTSL